MDNDTTVPSYWLNWRFLLCAIWISGAIVLSAFMIWRFEGHDKSSKQLTGNYQEEAPRLSKDEAWTTCSKTVHPVWLLAYRVVSFWALLALILADTIVHSPRIFFFYTQWTFSLVTIYFAMASAISIYGCLPFFASRRNDSAGIDAERGSSHGENRDVASINISMGIEGENKCTTVYFWGTVLQVIFQICAGAVVLTDSVFWLVLFPFFMDKSRGFQFLAAAMHSFNIVFLLGDAILNNVNFPFFRIAYFLLWTCTFVVFQWIYHVFISKSWPYPFLDLSSPYAPLWYFGVGLMHLPSYGIFTIIFMIKRCWLSK